MVFVPVWPRVPGEQSSSVVAPRAASALARNDPFRVLGSLVFTAHDRLRTQADFSSLRGGSRLTCSGVRLIYANNGLQHARLGLAVSRKFGNAVQRNRLKRQWRERFRVSAIRSFGVDILAIPTCPAPEMEWPGQAMEQALQRLTDRLKNKP